MALDERLDRALRWYFRGVQSPDPFEQFVWMWIALELTVKVHVFSGPSRWRARTIEFFRYRTLAVEHAIIQCSADAQWLAKRSGPSGGRVLDVSQDARARVTSWVGHVDGTSSVSSLEVAEGMGEILAAVRNNLFHGDKDYNADREAELLNHVNPLLRAFLAAAERWPMG